MTIIDIARVEGDSMAPTLTNNNLLLYSKLNKEYSRFDIVIIKIDKVYYIKRIIGLPGETIEYKNNTLFVNGNKVIENFNTTATNDFSLIQICPYNTIPENNFLVLGDNREVSYKYANGSTVKLHINDLIYVYPYSDKYMILSFNSDNTKALVIRYSECINANKLNTNEMLIIDLTCDKAIPPTEDNGGIPYTYKEESVEP